MKRNSHSTPPKISGLLFILIFFQVGCSLFLGNIKPVDEKSDAYEVLDLSKTNTDWERIDSKSPNETSTSDMVFQSKSTGSIVSLNSACKSYSPSEKKPSLQELTRELLLGFQNVVQKDQVKLVIEKIPALQTTVQGQLNDQEVAIRTVVLQRVNCLYDLMYISRPENFSEKERDFSRFVTSLHLR
jgi:hypothetical protein